MSKSLRAILSETGVVPASAKKDKIDNQYLEPGSYDKKLRDAAGADTPTVYDKLAPENEAENFKAQDTVKKNTKAPLKEAEVTSSVGESSPSQEVNELYYDESLELIDEILDLLDKVDEEADADSYRWRDVAQYLKSTRDALFVITVNESVEGSLEENFKAGNFKLGDGSSVVLSKDDVKSLNQAISGTDKPKEMIADVTKSKKEFGQFLTFAKNLREDFYNTSEELLEGLSIEELEMIAEGDFQLDEIWAHTKAGAKAGAKIGGKVGLVTGTAGGALYGGTAGAATGVAKKIAQMIKNRKAEPIEEAKDQNNEKESILGTSAPAMDSDPNTAKKKPVPVTESEDLSDKQFLKDTKEYKTASTARKIALEKKWGARSAYFREEEDHTKLKAGEKVVTPHDVAGKMPKVEGTVFTLTNGKKMKLTRIADNRLYGTMVNEEEDCNKSSKALAAYKAMKRNKK